MVRRELGLGRTFLIHLSASVHFNCKLLQSRGNQKTKNAETWRAGGGALTVSHFTFDENSNHILFKVGDSSIPEVNQLQMKPDSNIVFLLN